MTLTLSSTAFTNGGEIPPKYTCEGNDISPALEWTGMPDQTRSLVLIVDDPDAPDPRAPKMTWVHWVLFNIHGGPCPPVGRHRYFHKLYALDTVIKEMKKASKATIEAAMVAHIIAETELIGTYEKSG
ncbi:MAG: YbhB/YbcL family Raf kinase inhibitor-like protein [Deltaproteobacteria bacterium]|nr:YbhB/YbcL family Raf kinase inhibitor-like protein [Deltaproteobacteria bacterium]